MIQKKLHKKGFDEMKIFRKGFAVAMAMIITCSAFTVMPLTTSAMAVNETSVSASSTKSGKCGKDVKWSYNNKVLTVYGKGKMTTEIPESVTNYAEEIIVKDGVTDIGKLETGERLKKVTLGKGITVIPGGLFAGCVKLKTVKLSNNLRTIENDAFRWCESLTTITIPEKVRKILANPFMECSKLTKINVNKNNKTYISIDGILFTKSKKTLAIYPLGKKNSAYSVPKTVYKIAENAFSESSSIKTIKMTNSVKRIEDNAFAHCYRLKNVTLSQRLTYIGEQVFNDTEFNDTDSNWKNGYLYCGNALISVKQNLKQVTVKKGTRILGTRAIDLCENLKKVTLPEGLLYINDYALHDDTKLSTLTIPKSVKKMGKDAIGVYSDIDWYGNCITSKVNPFKVKVYKNSVGHKYAKKNNLNYQVIK
ncbi:MAG: leucine-rich repeat domain-containing protein [Ruminococcus sp.]|nr:leucine-rich repeat domain-containing protein [Ruminococcus sp.]MDD6531952.1 leucine-rich repeat domain-containing protein [Ruminococcus sp.]